MGQIDWSKSYSAEKQVGGPIFYRVQCVNETGGLTTFPTNTTEHESVDQFREVKRLHPECRDFVILRYEPYFHVWSSVKSQE